MRVTHIPREAVALLNVMRRPHDARAFAAARERFAALRAHADRWLRFHGAYTLHDREAADMANIAVLWDEIDAAVDDASVERLAPRLYEVVSAMDAVLVERQRPHFSLQPAVNDFVMASASVVLGRGEWRAVDDRLPIVGCWLDNTRALQDGAAGRLRPEIGQELERGIEMLEEAVRAARGAAAERDTEKLREAAFRLQSGAVLLQHFIEWTRRDDARLAEQYTRFNIPVAGPVFEHCLEAARRTPRAAWEPALRHLQAVVLPRLRAFWAHARERALLPWRVREQRLAAVDAALETLVLAVEMLREPSARRSEALDGVEAALETLSRAFDAVDRDAVRRAAVRDTQGDDWYELLGGALTGTVPDMALARAVQLAHPPAEVRTHVEAWLGSGDPQALSDALEALVERAARREQPSSPSTWACSCCGADNPQGEAACGRCQRRPEPLVTASWEA